MSSTVQKAKKAKKITISLPTEILKEVEELEKKLKMPKSEILSKALEKFSRDYKAKKLQKIAKMMAPEYMLDSDLVAMTSLDSEEFR
ncbi:MAG: ribbon-helix-helix domain-containing protein [Candidatus Brocadia sp.]|jgi:Ribbon-helix-helix protein, copG family.|uniref:Ribbon-helix-helix protein, copG family n=1 Tax=Candidatus Brocadia fulgida TaxID=380242 RepID=A0A0M2UYE0_9BACT|nr:MAG: Ribbon-helix-helix protein, copG family [Candidatus Brocadia fulgida]UJS21150.1 MAG: ribbon-helix-helix domain-containing protein [Candidatus Brocadia sp.]